LKGSWKDTERDGRENIRARIAPREGEAEPAAGVDGARVDVGASATRERFSDRDWRGPFAPPGNEERSGWYEAGAPRMNRDRDAAKEQAESITEPSATDLSLGTITRR